MASFWFGVERRCSGPLEGDALQPHGAHGATDVCYALFVLRPEVPFAVSEHQTTLPDNTAHLGALG